MVMATCYVTMVLITTIAKQTAMTIEVEGLEPLVTFMVLVVLSFLGVYFAMTFFVPFSMGATFTKEVGGG
jgi:hypothetical protein